jgi:protein-tyrosine-phosphatase/DNA-binding transcriptional ArsR family regulator
MIGTTELAAAEREVTRFFRALADETRLAIVRLLMLNDLRAGEVVQHLQLPANGVSYHLKHLRDVGLLRDRRSSLDARDIYYSIDLDRLHALYRAAGDTLYPGMAQTGGMLSDVLDDRPLRVLFLCTHNSARSQLAEGILRSLGREQVEVFSAGTEPADIHPIAVALLAEWGADTSSHSSKSMEQFRDDTFDYVITVCDRARESCPTFPNDPQEIHWSLPDPIGIENEQERWRTFQQIRRELYTRLQYLLSLPHPGTGRRFVIHHPTSQQLANSDPGSA